MSRNISKIISKSLNSKYSQKLIDHAKQSATARLKLQKESFKKPRKQPVI